MKWKSTMAILSVSCSLSSAATDIGPLISNNNLWDQTPDAVTQTNQKLAWHKHSTTAKDLTFLGKKVPSVSIFKAKDNTVNQVRLNLITPLTAKKLPASTFGKTAAQWKKLLDAKFEKKGTQLPAIKGKGFNQSTIAWKLENSIYVLTAKGQQLPSSLSLTIYDKEAGMNNLRETVATAKKLKEQAKQDELDRIEASKIGAVGKNLKGITSYLSGSSLSKKNISGAPKYYLFYFTASW